MIDIDNPETMQRIRKITKAARQTTAFNSIMENYQKITALQKGEDKKQARLTQTETTKTTH